MTRLLDTHTTRIDSIERERAMVWLREETPFDGMDVIRIGDEERTVRGPYPNVKVSDVKVGR